MARKAEPKKPVNKGGRPSSFTETMAEAICARLANGESLRSICLSPDTPSIETVRRWLIANEQFRAQYARAREEQADYYADEIVEIADHDPDSQRARVRIDARKWVACKLKPKVYGDKLGVEQSGSLTVNVSTGVPSDD